jgi:hypothetical protein
VGRIDSLSGAKRTGVRIHNGLIRNQHDNHYITDKIYIYRYTCLQMYLRFYYYHWERYLCLRTINPRGYHPHSSQCLTLTWLIRYIYYLNLQFLNNVIIIKTTDLLLQAKVTLVNIGFHV